jgi:hypothetical protein
MLPPSQSLKIVGFALALMAGLHASTQAAQSSESEPLQEVLVTASRIQLERRVAKFVYQVAALQNAEGMPRWKKRLCPQVTGLPKEEGEFVVGRISEVARAAGAPLAAEICRPNLFIIVTMDPKRLLSGMNEPTRVLTFAGASPSVVDAFVAKSRPVRVWYRTGLSTPEGIALGDSDRTDVMENVFGRYPAVAPETSYTRRGVIWSFTRLLVVADQRQLQGLSSGQFADYLAMVSLAQLKPDVHVGDAPTILKLFDSAPGAAPGGLSEWDMAFLKSLYATDQTSKGQREQIARAIVSEVSH